MQLLMEGLHQNTDSTTIKFSSSIQPILDIQVFFQGVFSTTTADHARDEVVHVNPLSPRSDQHETSPYNILT